MHRPRSCPHCQTIFAVDQGFHFAKDLTLLCDACKKPIYPTSYMTEGLIDAYLREIKNQVYLDRYRDSHAQIHPIKPIFPEVNHPYDGIYDRID